MPLYDCGHLKGAGAAVNLDLGFMPDEFDIWNCTDGDVWTKFVRQSTLGYDSGSAIAVGDQIVGRTSGAKATVLDMTIASGTLAGGDAAGVLILDPFEVYGTFANDELLTVGDAADVATVNGTIAHASFKVAAAVAAATSNDVITPYYGADASKAVGVTLGSTVMEAGKLFFWSAKARG